MIKDINMARLDTGRVYNRKITIQVKEEQKGPHVPLDPWEDYITIWADEKFNRAKNFYKNDAPNVEYDKEFIIRYREDLDETMRIIQKQGKKEEIYEIQSIIPLDKEKLNLTIKTKLLKRDI